MNKKINVNECPKCGNREVEGDEVIVEGNEAWQNVGCLICGASWTAHYVQSHRADVSDIDGELLRQDNEPALIARLKELVKEWRNDAGFFLNTYESQETYAACAGMLDDVINSFKE